VSGLFGYAANVERYFRGQFIDRLKSARFVGQGKLFIFRDRIVMTTGKGVRKSDSQETGEKRGVGFNLPEM
jgi:hypothetical protein